MTTRNQVLQRAASYIGYRERRTRQHPKGNVTVFWDRLKPSYQGGAWCAAFVNDCLVSQGITQLNTGPEHPYLCSSMEAWARKHGYWRASKDLLPGDVLIFSEDGAFHTGFLERQRGSMVQTIEGNTSPGNGGSQANGGGVYRRLRSRSWVRGGISLAHLYSGKATPKTGVPALLDVDGELGPASVDALQWYLKVTPRDGVNGPATVKAIQTWAGVEATGRLTRDDVRAVQRKLGVTVDGQWGPTTTAQFQRFLNRRIQQEAAK